jgi:FdhE protein
MVPSENRRIAVERAAFLVRKFPESAQLLEFYIQIVQLQAEIAVNLDEDPRRLAQWFPRVRALKDLRVEMSEDLLTGPAPDDERKKFYWRVLLQPYAEQFRKPSGSAGSVCPSCGSKPVAGVLRGEGDGAKRSLVCSLCALEWPFRRVICVHCGEEDKEKLPVYMAAQIEHVRVEACDTCRTYIKSVDLTKDGFAVPQVDEIATVALNLWADEHEYQKVETNILGM